MINNLEIAKIFNQIADLLELKDENIFRVRAYRRAAQNLEAVTEDVSEIAKRKELTKIPGIGEDLAGKITEFIKTGKIRFFEKLKKHTSSIYLELITIPGIGPKTAEELIYKLKIKSLKGLEEKARGHKLSGIPGLGEKTESNILKGIELIRKGRERVMLGTALPLAEDITRRLKKLPETGEIVICGSLRRQKETIRDIDILVTSSNPRKIMNAFIGLPFIKRVLAHGPTKSSALIKEDIQVDVRVVEPESFGAALLYFTGSKEHNIHLRKIAVKKGLKINEYGVFNIKTKKKVGGKTEEEMYKTLGLPYIPPELREDRGEVESFAKGARVPRLIDLNDIKGDYHVHTKASDGSNSIEDIVKAAIAKNYEYVVISDHSKSLKIAGGLSEDELLKQIKAIREINKRLKNFRVLAGSEVDILEDGSLDYSDEILARLDVVTASIHTGFKQSKEKLTTRITRAMQNKYVNIIAHLSGRLIGERDAYPLNMDRIFKTARETNTTLEINAFPNRLDLDDTNAKRAKESGIMMAIGSDSHSALQLESMKYGVSVARRAWLEKKDVLNCLTADEALKRLKKG
ncbi:MAG: DNA polymerase/3'-5' exonuclease PolX [Candidatus Omnitrophica bacterium]|nr:DNA polymerase/3'-5' exonuclease PolX [Candidatus Omnitrophota bacterium]